MAIEKYDFLKMPFRVAICILVLILCKFTKCDNFPSLISTNATLAVVIDREFLAQDYEKLKSAIEAHLVYVRREVLKSGGVNVLYYSWAAINVKRDITAILSIASCSDTWRLFRSAEDENLLHMAISEPDCPRLPPNQAITIPLITRGEELPQLILDLRTAEIYKWKSVVVIFDNIVERDMVTRLIKSLTERININVQSAGISLIKIDPYRSLEEVRINIQKDFAKIQTKTAGANFLVIVNKDLIDICMDTAKALNLVNIKSQWLYVLPDTKHRKSDFVRFTKLLNEGDNIAFIYNTTETRKQCKDGNICHSEEIITSFTRALENEIKDEFEMAEQVSDEEWEATRPTKQQRRDSLLQKVKVHLRINGACGNCSSWSVSTGETWGREYQQNSSSGSVAELLSIGNWRPIDGPSLTDELFPHVTHGFRGKNLPMVTFHNPPWQIIKLNESGDVLEYSGLVFDIISELANSLNFTYTVEIVKDLDAFGHYINNTSNTSMEIADVLTNIIPNNIMEMVKNKTVALGACGFTITDESKDYINFTIPISTQTYTFLVARPRELSRALLFISPFTGDTWLCLAASIISMGPILYYIHRFSPVYEYKGIRMRGGLSSIQNCIWYMYGALLQQGGMHLPYADSARIIVGAWWLVVLVVATTYCGNLVAFLTFPKIDIPITTIDALLAHKDTVSWSFLKGNFLETQLQTTPNSRYKSIYDGRLEVEKSDRLIKDIENGKHVYIDWKIRLQYIMKKQYLNSARCDLALGQDEFFDEKIALIMAHNSPYILRINEEIKKLHQVGLIQKWLANYLPKRDRCWKNRHIVEVNNHTVNMDDMQGSFFVLFFGFLLSLCLILAEKLWYKHAIRKRKKIIQPFTT